MTISQEYINLSTMGKNAYMEARKGDGINLSYQEAVDNCRFVIDSDEKLRSAFQNFQELKDKEYTNNNADKDILTAVFLDKFQKRIFFVINNYEKEYLVYDFSSGKLTFVKDGSYALEEDDYFLTGISIDYKFDEKTTNKNIWHKATFQYFIGKATCPDPSIEDYSFDYIYYSSINSLSLNDMGEPFVYPSYVTIEPEDLDYKRFAFTKNARSA